MRGFTLIEALVVLTISAILVAVGVPMFNGTIASMRASEGANSLVAALDLARVEALRRGTTVSVCRTTAADPTACNDAAAGSFVAGDWASGWMVFADLGGSVPGVFNAATDERVLVQPQLSSGGNVRVEILGVGGPVNVVTFGADGLRAGAAVALRVAYPNAANGAALSCRTVTIGAVGQTEARRQAC
jgi:type IV fimbrial biogenesis protein FimT